MPRKADVHRSLELLEEYHAELFRPSDAELKMSIERVINVFKHSLFNSLCDIHEFYESVLLNERVPLGDKRWERSPVGTSLAIPHIPVAVPSISPLGRPHPPPPPRSPSRPSSKHSFAGDHGSFLQTSPINRIVDEEGREWEVEEVQLDVSKTGLGFSISGGCDREPDLMYNDRYIRVTDISKGGAVEMDGRILIGDVILFVNDWETANREHDFAVQALKNAGTFVRLLVKRLKHPPLQKALSQSHLSEPIASGTFQRSLSGVAADSRTMPLQPPVRSQSLHHLPMNAVATSPSVVTAMGTLPRRVNVQQQFATPLNDPGRQPRWVAIRKGEMGFGFNIVGGEDGEPVYITRVAPGGAADQTGNIRMGDVLLRVNDVDLSMATHGEAAVALKAIPQGAQVKLLLQFRPKEYSEFDERLQQQNYR
ncbi:hypothetical protein niasHT_005078 [Heterodera trifolii]|uniref:Uncharacterized protein n=1 Tax=Heterodera trifolii TaxID=157864 RepID=A0ABD2M8Q8_9BILA